MTRRDLQALAEVRLREAARLLEAGCPDGAYYLAGYAIECAIKACIAKRTQRYEFPDKARVNESYSHNLLALVRTAGLESVLLQAAQANPKFEGNWEIVRKWSEASRYLRHSSSDASDLLGAIKSRKDGVLKWLKNHW